MGVTILRAGRRLIVPGVRVIQTSAAGLTALLYLKAYQSLYSDTSGTTPATVNATAIALWNAGGAYDFLQSTSGNRPTLQTALPSVQFDGTDDYLIYTGALANVIGSIIVVFQTGATAFATRGAQVIFSSADNGTANNWFEIGITAAGRIYIESNVGGTKQTVEGSTFLAVSTNYSLLVVFDGTDYYASVNAVEQNPLTITNNGTFAWFGNVSSADNLVVGGTVTSGGIVRPFQGKIMELAVYAQDVTA
jgi:hypothetical protein